MFNALHQTGIYATEMRDESNPAVEYLFWEQWFAAGGHGVNTPLSFVGKQTPVQMDRRAMRRNGLVS